MATPLGVTLRGEEKGCVKYGQNSAEEEDFCAVRGQAGKARGRGILN